MEIPQSALESKVSSLLDSIYELRITKLSDLNLRDVLKRKNPYLYRAIGTGNALDIVKLLLDATISSSDETIFGNEFFEPLALWVAQQAALDGSIANESGAEGADIDVIFPDQYRMYAIKSGTAVFNSDSWKRQLTNFSASRLRLAKTKKHFDPVVGYGYGRTNSKRSVREIAGQAFWGELSGDPSFYIRIMQAMDAGSAERHNRFQAEYDEAINRFLRELLANFGNEDGCLNWDKLLEYNSAIQPPARDFWQTFPETEIPE